MKTFALLIVAVPALALADDPPPTIAPSLAPPSLTPPSQPPYEAPPPVTPTTPTTPLQPLPYSMLPEEITEFDASKPAPDGYTLVHRRRKGLIIGGALTFATIYGITAYQGLAERDDSPEPSLAVLAIPIAGPFIVAVSDKYHSGSEFDALARMLMFAVGCGQVTGGLLLYFGITRKRPILVRSDLVTDLQIAPTTSIGTSGLALSGRF